MPYNQHNISENNFKAPLDSAGFSLKKQIVLLAILASMVLVWMNRYTITPGQSGIGHAPVYKLDRWTGNVYVLYADGSSIEVIHKN